MKANELMIGDLVSMTFRKPLGEGKPIIDKICSIDAVINGWMECEPIPITEDILKANGFTKYNGHTKIYDQDYCWHIKGKLISVYIKDGVIYRVVLTDDVIYLSKNHRLKFVHELQHTLRLCGLNELADNFKLKEE